MKVQPDALSPCHALFEVAIIMDLHSRTVGQSLVALSELKHSEESSVAGLH